MVWGIPHYAERAVRGSRVHPLFRGDPSSKGWRYARDRSNYANMTEERTVRHWPFPLQGGLNCE